MPMLSVIFRQQHVQANAECIDFFIILFSFSLDIFWSILDANLKIQTDTSELVQEFT